MFLAVRFAGEAEALAEPLDVKNYSAEKHGTGHCTSFCDKTSCSNKSCKKHERRN